MLYKLSNIMLSPNYNEQMLVDACARKLRVDKSKILECLIHRYSIDARKKNYVVYNVSVIVSLSCDIELPIADVVSYTPIDFKATVSVKHNKLSLRPVIIGSGPAGLFSAYVFALNGISPIVVERGERVDDRTASVNHFWSTGQLNAESNVQFGEGGAGTFSDGKLNTNLNDELIEFVKHTFVEFGANEDILHNSKPHIGTDYLKTVVANMRNCIIAHGGEFHFNTKFDRFNRCDGNTPHALRVICSSSNGEVAFDTDALILAVGHSARDTFKYLHSAGINMEPKAFAVGVRIEHLQKDIDFSQYGECMHHYHLPPADYKLAHHTADGRGVYTFCMCPGGVVVPATSVCGGVVTNGMSYFARDCTNANSALLASVTPNDYNGLFGGIELQQTLEENAYELTKSYRAPVQRVEDFLKKRMSSEPQKVLPSYALGYTLVDFNTLLPEYIASAMREALPQLGRRLKGFDDKDAVLTGIESRSSCPIRILRDSITRESNIKGVYPVGEGAGYAGGITSSALDGIKTAIAIMKGGV